MNVNKDVNKIKPKAKAFDPQLPLFAPEPHPAVMLIADTNPDDLSPRQALDILYQLKSLAK